MTTNLINLIPFVRKNFFDYHVVYDFPPSFLDEILKKDEKIIFVCKKSNKKPINLLTTPPKLTTISENLESLDLTGSPLKDDCVDELLNFSMDLQLSDSKPWKRNEESFEPIEMEKVRAMILDESFQEEGKKINSPGSIWFLCKPTLQENKILMSFNFEPGHNSIGFIGYNDLIENGCIHFEKMISMHNSFLKGVAQTETHIENCYNIKKNICLKLSWSTSSARPQLINVKNCNTTLWQKIDMDDNDSVIEHFWRQLSILKLINEDILKFKSDCNYGNEIDYDWGSGVESDVLKEKIIEAMTEISNYCCSNDNSSNEIEPIVSKAINRNLTDITDKLWEILKCCSSNKDLKLGFTHVFQCAAQRNIINMPINENCLAVIIREVAQRRLAMPCLTGTEPLELLLEIGLEKLQKDYEYILTESKICCSSDLNRLQNSKNYHKETESNLNVRCTLLNAAQKSQNQIGLKNRKTFLHNLQSNQGNEEEDIDFSGFKNSKYNEKQTKIKLTKLSQIHVALKHLLSIQINLNLKNVYNQIFEQLLQKPFEHFPLCIDQSSNTIAIPILTSKVLGHVENKNPNIRRIAMSSTNKFKKVETVFYFNMENIYPPKILDSVFDVSEDKQSAMTENYFQSTYVSFKSRRI